MILFTRNYDSESMVDIFRDVSEALDKDFNDNISEDISINSVQVVLCFQHTQSVKILDRIYDNDTFCDMEEDVTDAITDMDESIITKDEYGFFPGTLILNIILLD